MNTCKEAKTWRRALVVFKVRTVAVVCAVEWSVVVNASRIMCVCDVALALHAYQSMRDYGFKATTASIELVCEACAMANADDAVDVYSALRGHGLSEFLCYTAAMKVSVPLMTLAAAEAVDAVGDYDDADAAPSRRMDPPASSSFLICL
jgi:hypothetical protein